MPWRNQNFLEWLYEILVNYGTVIWAFILTVAISVFSTAKKYGKVDWLEAIICGLLTLAISSLLKWFNLPSEFAIFIGGVIGFQGSHWVDKRFSAFWDRKFGNKDDQS